MNQSYRQAATAAPGAGPVEGPAWTTGSVRYMTPESESSLYRNGKVFTRRDRDGNDAGREGVVTEELTVAIGDARSLQSSPAMCASTIRSPRCSMRSTPRAPRLW